MTWLLLLGACTLQDGRPHWFEQVTASGPCHQVDLGDGLSEASTDELHLLHACLDQGNLEPLAPLVDALDAPARTGRPAGVELARLVNALPSAGWSWPHLVDEALRLLADPPPLGDVVEVGVELVYGRSYADVAAGGPDRDTAALEAGVLVPALPALGAMATAIRDSTQEPLEAAADLLSGSFTRDAVATLVAASRSGEERLAQVAGLPAILGEALAATEDATNDHADLATSSLEWFATTALGSDGTAPSPAQEVLEPVADMLEGDAVRSALAGVLDQAWRAGHLDPLLQQLALLARQDARGGSLDPGEDSALVTLLRLLHEGNREVDCRFLWWDLHVADNLSVWLLELLAAQDPETVDATLRVAGFTLEWDTFLSAVAGQCSVDSSTATDLVAVQRLVDAPEGDLLVVLLETLAALDEEDRIPHLVTTVSALHHHGLAAPVEEVVKDLAGTRLDQLAVSLLPALLDPWSAASWCADGSGSCARETWGGYDPAAFSAGREPLALEDLLDLPARLVSPSDEGASILVRVQAPLQAAAGEPGTWTALAHLGRLLQTPEARTPRILANLAAWQDRDPDGAAFLTVADLLRNPALTTPALDIAETTAVREALAATSPEAEGPLPFLARLTTAGTLRDLAQSLFTLLDLLLEASS